MYKTTDISVVIPTYNRPNDIKETLIELNPFFRQLNEVIIVDQTKDNSIKKIVKGMKARNLRYIFSKTPSITIARNLGVKKSSPNSKIICFFDDDITLGKNYFDEILKIFNKKDNAKAAAAYVKEASDAKEKTFLGKIERYLNKLFFLRYKEKDKARIISAYGNTYPLALKKTINSQWLQGVNMVYKKEIFKEQKFDENLLGYTIAEDTDFSYRLYKKYPGSVFITPFAQIKHRFSQTDRNPTERMSYINQVDHFYFNFKNLNKTLKQKAIFIWSVIGICLMRPFKFAVSWKKADYLKMKFFYKSLFYCLSNLDKIKQGKVREFTTSS